MPATSPGAESMTSALKPRCSPQRRYMRSSICAQSCASVPPAPAWMSRNALCESISPRNMRLNSSCARRASSAATSRSMSARRRLRRSLRARSSSSPASVKPVGDAVERRCDLRPGAARSRPSSCAFSGLFQIAGSSSSRLTSSSRSFLLSYSKKPPERVDALPEVFERALEQIEFHECVRQEFAS